jgi:hypothetical protein
MHFIKRVAGSKGFETKTITDDGAQRALDFFLMNRFLNQSG